MYPGSGLKDYRDLENQMMLGSREFLTASLRRSAESPVQPHVCTVMLALDVCVCNLKVWLRKKP